MGSYQITIRFTTDRPLTQDEMDLLLAACEVQVREPVNLEGDDMGVDVTISESEVVDHGLLIWDGELYDKIYQLLTDRLEKGKMVPFYKISPKMKSWMKRNGIREVGHAREWYERYFKNGSWTPSGSFFFRPSDPKQGYCGVIYHKTKNGKYGKYFYLELPIDLVKKAIVLGFFP